MRKITITAAAIIFTFSTCITSFAQEVDTGVSNESAGVVGGDNAIPGAYPWMVSLAMSTGDPGCGASLIRPQWVLTAGHCSIDFLGAPEVEGVIINSVIIDIDGLEAFSEYIEVEEVIVHEDYEGVFDGGGGPDIALVRLSEASLTIPIDLATFDDAAYFAHEMPAQVLGWGKTVEGGSSVDSLLHAYCIFMSDDTCADLSDFHDLNPDGNICAGFFEGMEPGGAAQGDSGGPLFFEDGTGTYKQVGVVSGGDSDATTASGPGVFTLVPKYIEWIENTIADYEGAASIQAENRESLLVTSYLNDRIEITGLDEADEYHISIYNVSGNLAADVKMVDENVTCNIGISTYQAGLYIVRVVNESNGNVTVEKFVVQ